ncbi:helix-turn-helix transcriptional regulator [Bacillus sp. 03113]|uniref:helix-turn-helix transcriptional regulator n=1 Tax=Bacillus sp. 03113 TaxID=2578211 RepID=UPI00114238AF|nr:helix-turn-helix transcriptional regulator [Bacillus sp. 03113]
MKKATSIFIMDVTNSTSEKNWFEITKYLQEWEKYIGAWCENTIMSKVSHRRGDEILFVSYHHFTAFTIAYHISQHWKFTKQRPYFGISYGFIDEDIENLDIEIWNHPLIKKARDQNAKIKKDKNRYTNMLITGDQEKKKIISTTDILNLLIENQQALLQNQSENQKLIYSLYSIFHEQKQVAKVLNKTQSTISTHYKRGQSELLLKNFYKIQKILSIHETSESQNVDQMMLLIHDLNTSIRNHLKDNVKQFFPELKM